MKKKKRKKLPLIFPGYWKVVATVLGTLFLGTGAMQLITSNNDALVFTGIALLVLLIFGLLILWIKPNKK